MYRWIIFLHVVSAFIFFMAHGVSIGVALWLRREHQLERLRMLLELSDASRRFVRGSLVVLLLSGIAGGFMLNWWHMGWIWVSLALLVFITVVMFRGMSPYFNKLRKAVGSPYQEGGKIRPALEAAPAAEIEALLTTGNMVVMTGIGIGIMVVIVYLMMFKPF
jgi:predicted PurR-regulated permease PerM